MTDSGGLQNSLAAMGFIELALAFIALGCYCLILNGAIGTRARSVAAGSAGAAALMLVVLTDPWMNGMILVAIGVAVIGIFVALAWALSAACGFGALRQAEPAPAFEAPTTEAPVVVAKPRLPNTPAHSA
jgi:hypothetical protein